MFNNKKGVVMLYIVFFLVAVLIIILAAVLAPMGVLFNSKMYEAGEQLLLDANDSIGAINNSVVRASIYASIDEGLSATQTNIDVNADIFQYGWIVVIIVLGLIAFIFSRRTVETAGGFT